MIAAAATGFIYYVSREGVTGVREKLAGGIPEAVARIRLHTRLPVAVGFGISTRARWRRWRPTPTGSSWAAPSST
jgi:tryptophan synthase alpha chain